MAEAAAEDHRQPLRRAQPAGHARAARRRPRPAVADARGRDRRPHLARPEGAGRRRRWARSRAPTCTNDIDFTGSARRVARRSPSRMVGDIAHGRDRADARAGGCGCTSSAATARNIAHHYDVSQRVLPALARPSAWSTRARISATTTTRSTRAQIAEARPHLPQAAARARRALPRHRLRLGRAAVPRGASATASTRPASRCRRTSSSTCTARSPRAGSRAACASSCATTSTCPKTRSTTRSRASACSSTSASRRFPKYFGKIRRILKPGGFVLNHGITHNPLGARQPGQRHRRLRRGVRVSRAASSTHVAQVIEGMAAQGLEVDRRRGAARALREDAVALGRAARGATRTRRAREVGEEKLPRLAHLPGRLGARVRPRLAVAVAAPRRQAAPRRPAAASADARLHVRRAAERPGGAPASSRICRRRRCTPTDRIAAHVSRARSRSR